MTTTEHLAKIRAKCVELLDRNDYGGAAVKTILDTLTAALVLLILAISFAFAIAVTLFLYPIILMVDYFRLSEMSFASEDRRPF